MATVDPRGQQKSARCHSYVYTRGLWRLTHTHPIPQWLQEIAQPGAGARGGDASVPAWLQEIAQPETGARAATVPVLALRQQGAAMEATSAEVVQTPRPSCNCERRPKSVGAGGCQPVRRSCVTIVLQHPIKLRPTSLGRIRTSV